jgi:hypothetical protein
LISANKELLASIVDGVFEPYKTKSFHLANYCVDNHPESKLFLTLPKDIGRRYKLTENKTTI